MNTTLLFWLAVGSIAFNAVLLILLVALFVAYRMLKARHESQMRIWFQATSGITMALDRILNNSWEDATGADVANAVHVADAAVMALYQSLYEEKDTREEDKRTAELMAKYEAEEETALPAQSEPKTRKKLNKPL